MNGENEGCKELIRDWSAIGWKEGTTDLDLSDPMRGHISAAMDYSEYISFDMNMGADTGSAGVGAMF